MFIQYVYTFAIAWAGGWIFSLLQFPLPWTLGPLATTAILKIRFHAPLHWSGKLRNLGLLLLGYVMGSPFTQETGRHILAHLPAILSMAVLTVVLSLSCGYGMRRFMDINRSSALLGSMPGGLSQMVVLCLDIKGANTAVVTLMQTVRLLTVLFTIPFIARTGLAEQVDAVIRVPAAIQWQDLPLFLFFGTAIFCAIYGAKRLNIYGVYATIPMLATAALVLAGAAAPPLPGPVIAAAQIFIGIQMGLSMNIASLANWRKLFALNVLSVLSVITLLAAAYYALTKLTDISFLTAFISTSPGGISEMGLTAMMVHADLSTVIAFQLFRLQFVLLVAIPLLRRYLNSRPDPLSPHDI